jgi:hypothetical protein
MRNLIQFKQVALLSATVGFLAVGCSSTGVANNGDEVYSGPASVLSYSPLTRAKDMNKFPQEYNVRSIEVYTFAAPEPNVVASADLPSFSADLPPGTVFVEAAGADQPARVRRVIQQSPSAR